MKLPILLSQLETDSEDEILISLSELSGTELLELQAAADKITELVLIIHLSREYINESNNQI